MISSAQRARLQAITYQAGETAPVTGLYRVIHAREHRLSHEAVVLQGDAFPSCRSCKNKVVFTLEQSVDYLLHDMDFAGPAQVK